MNPRVRGIIAGAVKARNTNKKYSLYRTLLHYLDRENGISYHRLLREYEVSQLPEEERTAIRNLRLKNVRGF